MKSKEELNEMVNNLKYPEVFEELDAMGQNSATYNALKLEFIDGNINYNFPKRLKVFINNIFLKKKITKISAIIIIPILLSFAGFWAYKNYFPTPPTCFFKAEDKNFKVLILPFKTNGCDKKDDVGAEISRQLENLNRKEKLEISQHFADKLYITSNFTDDSAYILKEKYCADMVVHGNYGRFDCNSQNKQDVCLVWQMDSIPKVETENNLMMAELSKGKLQCSVRSMIFWIAGNKNFDRKNYNQALKHFLYMQDSLGNEFADVKFNIALCFKINKDYKNSKLYYQQSISIDSSQKNVISYNNFAMLLANDYFKDYEGAKKNYEKAIKLEKNMPRFYNNFAMLLANDYFKDYEGAKKNYEKAIAVDKTYAPTYAYLGGLLQNSYFKDYEGAKKNYEKAIQLDKNDYYSYNGLAYLLGNDYFKDYEGAKRNFEKAIELDTNRAMSYHNLAYILGNSYFRDYEGAKKNYEKVIELDKNRPDTYYNLAILLTNDYFKDYQNAEINYLKAIKFAPEDVVINLNYAWFLFQYKNPLVYSQHIQKYYRKAIQLNPQAQNLDFEQQFQQVTGQSLR
jgi:tetratricopeptide (TPR) repeat protein